jgi:hypothetical protein
MCLQCGFVDLLGEKAIRTSVESSPVELNHACFLFSDKLKVCVSTNVLTVPQEARQELSSVKCFVQITW